MTLAKPSIFLLFLIFSSCAASPMTPPWSIIPTTGSAVSQTESGTFQIQTWQNPEADLKTDIKNKAIKEAEKTCKQNGFPGGFKISGTEYEYSPAESITLTIECSKEKP